ncbi:MAG: hypothetical protein EA397_18275 [Deltaproteobacteria bacterium]|nr:MAG: hypothetical protein EA397_18275 [Deltaproteobacteria bacterium]
MKKSTLLLLSITLTACSQGGDIDSASSSPSSQVSSSTDSAVHDTDSSGQSSSSDSELPFDTIPLLGTWADNWNGEHLIDADRWTMGDSVFHLTSVDAQEGWAVAENDDANAFNPSKWSRFDWVEAEHNGWWFCQTAFDAESEEDALTVEPANADDPASTGCGDFAWSRLYVPLPIRGEWEDGFGGDHTVYEWSWTMGDSVFHITNYDAEERWIVAHNDAENDWSPEKWSRFEWVEADGSLWFCQVRFDADTEDEALEAESADTTDPSSSGCGGFAWSELVVAD